MPKPPVPRMANVKTFLTNEPVEASLVNVAKLILVELLQAPRGPIPTESILGHPLGSNIQHILEDLDLKSEDLMGMGKGTATVRRPSIHVEVVKPQARPLSPIQEAGTTSRIATSKRPRSLTPVDANQASGLKRPHTTEASDSENSVVVKPSEANQTIGGKLAKLKSDLKGNLFLAVVNLIDHDKLQMERDIFARGMAKEMMFFQLCVSVLVTCFLVPS